MQLFENLQNKKSNIHLLLLYYFIHILFYNFMQNDTQ